MENRRYTLQQKPLLALISTLVLGTLEIVPAAAEETQYFEEVLVTARRQSESLQTLPVSATVFDSEKISKARIYEIADYFLITPNVALNETGTRSENSISIRGVSNIGNGINSSFAMYVDELNVIPLISNPQLQDIEQIEVLRGPQGTFYGRNAAGGAINISTNKPVDTFEGNVFLEASRFDTYQGAITVNAPVTDNFFLRGTGYVYQTDGWIENENAAGGSNDQTNYSGHLAGRLLLTENLTIDTSVMVADENSGLESGVPTGVLSVGSIGLWGLNAIGEVPFFPENTNTVNNDNPKEIDYQFTLFNNRVHYQIGDYTLSSVTGIADGNREMSGDVDATSFDAVNLTRDTQLDFLSQEFRLAFNPADGISWTVGGVWFEQTLDVDLQVVLGSFNPLGAPGGTVIRELESADELKSWALFGEIDIPLTDRLTLTYGGRYSNDEVSASQTAINGTPMGPVTQVIPNVTRDFDDYSNKFALSYAISDSLSGYLLASQGYRAGGIQLDPGLAEPEFEPETLWNYEAGIKGTALDGRVRFAAAVYKIDWQDLQVRTIVNGIDPATGALTIATGVDNAAEASSTGFELELEALVTDSTQVGLGIGYMDAKYEDYSDAVIDGAVALIDLSGKPLLNAPELTWNAYVEQGFTLAGWDGFLRGEYSFVDEKITSNLVYVPSDLFPVPFDFTFPYQVPEFEVFNLRVGLSNEKYSIVAYAENVTDENYYTGTFDDLFASGVHVRTHPREVGVRVSANF